MVELSLRSRGGEPAQQRSGSDGRIEEFLAFTLAGELYGVALSRVKEIVTLPLLTRVPRAPRDVLGVCSVRGLLATVVDLRLRLGVPAEPFTRRSRILLIEAGGGEVLGLCVDEVRQVVRLSDGQIELASQALGGEVSEHVRGIGRPSGQGVMVLLELKSIVSGQRP